MTSKGEVSSVLLWRMRRLITDWVVVYVYVEKHSDQSERGTGWE